MHTALYKYEKLVRSTNCVFLGRQYIHMYMCMYMIYKCMYMTYMCMYEGFMISLAILIVGHCES